MSVTVLCARSGEGKTTFLCQQSANWAARGRSVGGVVSPVVFVNDRRAGYDCLDLRTGHRQPLARTVQEPGRSRDDALSVGVFRFDEVAVAAGNRAVILAVRDGLDVVVVDEVGPLEIRGHGWAPALEIALQACRPGQQLVITVRPTLADELPRRFPAPIWARSVLIGPPWPAFLET